MQELRNFSVHETERNTTKHNTTSPHKTRRCLLGKPPTVGEEVAVDGREFMRRLNRSEMRHAERMRRWLVEMAETPEQRQQREALEEEERLRRVLAKIGYTPEEFEDAVQEFKRKFYAGDR